MQHRSPGYQIRSKHSSCRRLEKTPGQLRKLAAAIQSDATDLEGGRFGGERAKGGDSGEKDFLCSGAGYLAIGSVWTVSSCHTGRTRTHCDYPNSTPFCNATTTHSNINRNAITDQCTICECYPQKCSYANLDLSPGEHTHANRYPNSNHR